MSLAPDRIADGTIGLGRLFTSAGVDPYDEIVWERRDARITNWIDGSVAFEQLDVEFPVTWSLNATNIVTQKYFRGTLGTPEREWSLKQVVDRIVDTIADWGIADGYFDGDEAAAFRDELKYILITQRAAFNSPVWFNIGVRGVPQQASACFILAVEDEMPSILNWYREEGLIFKGGSGAGVNLSRIRSSFEPLEGGGTASGPVSFMRGADASAGTIKSGGKTRRAAKMVILDADHPDIEQFVWAKAIEERKARVLADAGFDMGLDGADSFSVQYQNANNSVRVTDEFMQAVVGDGDWDLTAVTTGEVLRTVKARTLWREIAEAAWECADPGLQFDTTINRWHTAPNHGRITASNPCFTGDSLVHTDKGLIRFDELFARANVGEDFKVWTHDITNADAPADEMQLTTPEAFMITGKNAIQRLRFSNGMELRCTPSHRIFTLNRGYVEAEALTPDDQVRSLDLAAPAVNADVAIPVRSDWEHYRDKGDRDLPLRLPDVWSDVFAHYVGWLVGDGSTSGTSTVTIYGSADDRSEILPAHQDLLEDINDGRPIKLSEQANGTAQLRLTRRPLKKYLEALGVASVTGEYKTVPWSIEQAPPEIVAAFLRGLFDADGCAVHNPEKGSYVGLGSISVELLRGVQRLLSTFGITSRMYSVRRPGASHFSYERKDGTVANYESKASFDLRITGRSMHRFAAEIGFSLSRKSDLLREAVTDHGVYAVDTSIRLVDRTDEGVELTYNLSEPRNHSYVVNGVVVRNCSEYLHVDNSACNLASINLLKFLQDDGGFDVGAFTHTVDTVFTAQEILVGRADYPTEKIGDNTRALRQLGLGYANLGALLMALGLPYDSDDGRAWAAAITSLMTGSAYAASARTAARVGPFEGFADDSEAMLHVLEMHQEANDRLAENEALPDDLVDAAADAWERALSDAQRHGVRNSQATVLAPTGCLVGGSMVATSKGLVRLRSLGDPDGPTWQTIELDVATDDGPRAATKFFVNGAEPVVEVTTARGYHVAGTTMHRIKVVGPDNQWRWTRFADLEPGDRVPLAMHQLVGDPQHVRLPLLSEKMTWAGEWHLVVPEAVDEELAMLVGYFMGDGSLHSRGLRFCVSGGDTEVADVLVQAGKSLFNLEAAIADREGYTEVAFHSTRLVEWWSASGFARLPPSPGHSGKGYSARVPDAILASNDPEVYRAFLRGLFEADGSSTGGYPSWTTTSLEFSRDVQRLLLALGFVTTRRECTSGMGSTLHVLRLLNRESNVRWSEEIGFISSRKAAGVHTGQAIQSARYDHLPVSRELIDRVAPENGRNRRCALMELRRHGAITRRLAFDLLAERDDEELRWLTSFFFDRVEEVALCDEEFSYDLSVPDNLTYIANGFVSHNTIGLAMDCDTTGIEPDLALVKTKKLVGGGTMSIVNQTIPRALRRLGCTPEQVDDIVAYIDEHMSVIGAPHLAADHLPVFACSMGDNTIHYEGHIRMMGAVQPFLSGGISKTANMPEDVTVEDVEGLHMLAWELGLKSVAIYRDNCKLGQPLSSSKGSSKSAAAEPAGEVEIVERIVHHPVRQKMPRTRRGRTFEFRVADCKGFATIGEYDDGQPGEIFLTVSKQGSTMAGVMDAFAKSVSYGLQYGVPLRAFVEAFTNMRFEPAGMTDDPDIRFASSIMDYLFRRLAIEYMTYDERAELGIFSIDERLQPTLPGVEEHVTATNQGSDLAPDPKSVDTGQLSFASAVESPMAGRDDRPSQGMVRPSDAPMCMQCGVAMMRSGSCYVCTSCGSTSGCS